MYTSLIYALKTNTLVKVVMRWSCDQEKCGPHKGQVIEDSEKQKMKRSLSFWVKSGARYPSRAEGINRGRRSRFQQEDREYKKHGGGRFQENLTRNFYLGTNKQALYLHRKGLHHFYLLFFEVSVSQKKIKNINV